MHELHEFYLTIKGRKLIRVIRAIRGFIYNYMYSLTSLNFRKFYKQRIKRIKRIYKLYFCGFNSLFFASLRRRRNIAANPLNLQEFTFAATIR